MSGYDTVDGLSQEEIMTLADDLEPGMAAGILLVEHLWAIGFRVSDSLPDDCDEPERGDHAERHEERNALTSSSPAVFAGAGSG